jgi:opacity protein-like surface antigen
MKAISLAAIAAASLLAATNVASADIFIEGMGGVNFDPDLTWNSSSYKMQSGYNAGGGIGFSLNDLLGPDWYLRADALYTNSRYSCCTSHLDSLTLTGDLVYTWANGSPFTPYFGGGVGAVDTIYTSGGSSATGWGFAWEGLAGVDWAAFQPALPISLFAEYRYQNGGKVTATGSYGTVHHLEYQSNILSAGLRVHI